MIQISNEPVFVFDHDFSVDSKHKLILFIYLFIDSNNTNNSLYFRKMQIFICLKYFLSISSEMHMINLIIIIKEEAYNEFTYYEGLIKHI